MAGHDPTGTCLFEDILELLPYKLIDDGATYSKNLSAVQCCCLSQVQCCGVRVGELCSVATGSDFCVAGLPCPDMSVAGKQLKRAGPTAKVYMAAGRYNSVHETALLLVECTPDTWPMVK